VTPVVAAAALLVLVAFVAGTILNVRKGRELMRWMQGGLPLLGERASVRWLGSTAVELFIREAKPPFEEVKLVLFMEPRDVPWLWALGRLGGRRDTLILRARLRRPPRVAFEVLDPKSWSGRDALRGGSLNRWSVRGPTSPGDLATYFEEPSGLPPAEALSGLARRSGLEVRRLSLRASDPHFQLHLALPRPGADARAFFEAVRALGDRARVAAAEGGH